jgi:hypothetical protein
MSHELVLEFEGARVAYDDAASEEGQAAFCAAVTRCVLPLVEFSREDALADGNGAPRNCSKLVQMAESYLPRPVPGSPKLVQSVVVRLRVVLRGSPELFSGATRRCANDVMLETRFFARSSADSHVSFVAFEAPDDRFLWALLPVTMVLLFAMVHKFFTARKPTTTPALTPTRHLPLRSASAAVHEEELVALRHAEAEEAEADAAAPGGTVTEARAASAVR